MDNQEIKHIIENALSILYRTEKEIINDETHEQTISARLMLHLQHLLPEWNVDVEFNRQGENRGSKTDNEGENRKPDIIIHKRGPKGPNLAVILVKCEWNTKSRENDKTVAQSIKVARGYQTAFVLEIKQSGFQLN
ncbi:MAG: hypothetical protein ABIC96_03100 [Patescibacteria group bacterium]